MTWMRPERFLLFAPLELSVKILTGSFTFIVIIIIWQSFFEDIEGLEKIEEDVVKKGKL